MDERPGEVGEKRKDLNIDPCLAVLALMEDAVLLVGKFFVVNKLDEGVKDAHLISWNSG